MKLLPALLTTTVLLTAPVASHAADVKPLHALLILGGCCHDYAHQKDILKKGIEERANVVVDIAYNADTTTQTRFDIYEKKDWAKGYDVVIHDECSADVKDVPYVQNILDAHAGGIPAVNLHCAMHCYRTGTDMWFKYIGIQSSAHGPQKPIEITYTNSTNPIIEGLPNWTTINEELYNNIKLFDTATPLAFGKQDTGRGVNQFVVVWVNDYNGTRIFNTTIGHNNVTVSDDRYLDLVTRGMLWSCKKLNKDYLKPKKSAAITSPVMLASSVPQSPQATKPCAECP